MVRSGGPRGGTEAHHAGIADIDGGGRVKRFVAASLRGWTLIGLMVFSSVAFGQAKPKAELILVNGKIYSGFSGFKAGNQESKFYQAKDLGDSQVMVATGTSLPPVQAIAVAEGRIILTGSNDQVKKLAHSHTQVIDLQGTAVFPGFNDAHAHLANGGFAKLNVDLEGAKDLADMQQRIAERVKTAAPGEWIIGRGWDHTKWPVKETPTKADID